MADQSDSDPLDEKLFGMLLPTIRDEGGPLNLQVVESAYGHRWGVVLVDDQLFEVATTPARASIRSKHPLSYTWQEENHVQVSDSGASFDVWLPDSDNVESWTRQAIRQFENHLRRNGHDGIEAEFSQTIERLATQLRLLQNDNDLLVEKLMLNNVEIRALQDRFTNLHDLLMLMLQAPEDQSSSARIALLDYVKVTVNELPRKAFQKTVLELGKEKAGWGYMAVDLARRAIEQLGG